MTQPCAVAVFEALEATWCPAAKTQVGPWLIRDGQGGGQRVSAATAQADITPQDVPRAEAAFRELGQTPLFKVRHGEVTLDAVLAHQGYRIGDPTELYVLPVADLTGIPVPPFSAFALWPPLAIMADIWASGGVGAARLAVMNRVEGSKTALLARHKDQPAGVAFVAIHDEIAMIHAIEVVPALRRQGVARNILRAAGHWAEGQGAIWFGLAVTRANASADALYSSMGMTVVGSYHYRIK